MYSEKNVQDDIAWGMDGTWNVRLENRWEESDGPNKLSFKSLKVVCVCVWKKD